MWCAHCQADVATDVSPDNRRIRCATCAADLATSVTGSSAGVARDARELLARWSQSDLMDPFGPVAALRPRGETEPKIEPPADSGTKSAKITAKLPESPAKATDHDENTVPDPEPATASRHLRFDESPNPATAKDDDAPPPHVDVSRDGKSQLQKRQSDERNSGREPQNAPPRRHVSPPVRSARRVHRPHSVENRAPHISATASRPPRKQTDSSPSGNAESILGHLIAYLGVLGLTIGGILIVWSYFGGPENYAPTGWFITTIGQMLLFLGVVTLVSKGLEQTTVEVTRRVDSLGEQLSRLEQALGQESEVVERQARY